MSIAKLTAVLALAAVLPTAAFAQAAKTDAAPAKPAAADAKEKDKDKHKEKLICERVVTVESSIGVRVCKTESEIKAEREKAARSVDAMNREVTLPSQVGSGRASLGAFGPNGL